MFLLNVNACFLDIVCHISWKYFVFFTNIKYYSNEYTNKKGLYNGDNGSPSLLYLKSFQGVKGECEGSLRFLLHTIPYERDRRLLLSLNL
jgi:hypothetical protein